MWRYVNDTLMQFGCCFSRKASFGWFVRFIIGLIIRTEHLGITSIVRALDIAGHCYESFLHFFRASSWKVEVIQNKWTEILSAFESKYLYEGKPIMVGDGVKKAKEARKMPGVMKLFQESENSSKPEYIFGHMYGCIGLLLGNAAKVFCAPVSMRIHDGNETVGGWAGDEYAKDSHVVRLIREACGVAAKLGQSFLLLDRYFLTVPALQALGEMEAKSDCKLLTLVVKAKSNARAFRQPTLSMGKGRPRKKGEPVKLQKLFTDMANQFIKAKVMMYGRLTEIEYLHMDLLWGEKLYQELRFVLVKYEGKQSILACTDLLIPPTAIVELYCMRFKIECCFRELNQVIAGFSYRFWSKYMPKLNRYKKNADAQDDLTKITDKRERGRIISAFKAIEGFALFSCIAVGIVQMVALRFHNEVNACDRRFMRTRSNEVPSEASTAEILRKTFFCRFRFLADLPIIRFIQSVQSTSFENGDSLSA